MPQIPTSFLQSVMAIGIEKSDIGPKGAGRTDVVEGTGLLYLYPSEKAAKERDVPRLVYLVTCKHIVENARLNRDQSFWVRMNRSQGEGTVKFTVPIGSGFNGGWWFHPTADVAVIPMDWEQFDSLDIKWSHFRIGLSRNDVSERGYFEGDEVFLLGFPVGWLEGLHDYPIVRLGVFAQIQGWLHGDHYTFLVDGSGFPGNSGGPVITKPQTFDIDEFNRMHIPGKDGRSGSYLVGIVGERKFSTMDNTGYSDVDLGFIQETADLIEVIPMDTVNETIDIALSKALDNTDD